MLNMGCSLMNWLSISSSRLYSSSALMLDWLDRSWVGPSEGGGGGPTGTGAADTRCAAGGSCISGTEKCASSGTRADCCSGDWRSASGRSDGLIAPFRAHRLGDTGDAERRCVTDGDSIGSC